jgi:hypothetical protein
MSLTAVKVTLVVKLDILKLLTTIARNAMMKTAKCVEEAFMNVCTANLASSFTTRNALRNALKDSTAMEKAVSLVLIAIAGIALAINAQIVKIITSSLKELANHARITQDTCKSTTLAKSAM